MGADLNDGQKIALDIVWARGLAAQEAEQMLKAAVRAADRMGVPTLTLANRLGVSRSRVRILARDEQ